MSHPLTAILDHDADAVLDYSLDWSELLGDGVTVSTSSWTVVDGTATLSDAVSGGVPATTHAGTIAGAVTTIVIRTASAGRLTLRNRIVASNGRGDDRTVRLEVGLR